MDDARRGRTANFDCFSIVNDKCENLIIYSDEIRQMECLFSSVETDGRKKKRETKHTQHQERRKQRPTTNFSTKKMYWDD